MKPTQTGIAVALALAVVVAFFIFPSLFPFNVPSPSNAESTQPVTMPSETITQLKITDEVVGAGAIAASGDTVTVNYVGAFTDGTVFDASANRGTTGFTFTLGVGEVIKGWDQGIVGMKEGGKRLLLIPASLAYGDQAIGNVIPANSALIFAVELVKVEKR